MSEGVPGFRPLVLIRDYKLNFKAQGRPKCHTETTPAELPAVRLSIAATLDTSIYTLLHTITTEINREPPLPDCGDGEYKGGGKAVEVSVHHVRDLVHPLWLTSENMERNLRELGNNPRDELILQVWVEDGEFAETVLEKNAEGKSRRKSHKNGEKRRR